MKNIISYLRVLTPLLRGLLLYASIIVVFLCGRILFLLLYPAGASGAGALLHGLPMDCTVAGYLVALPLLAFIAGGFMQSSGRYERMMRRALGIYLWIVSALLGVVTVMDAALYGYWNFRLDMTPFYYFFSSPGAAFASMTGWQIAGGTAAMAVTIILIRVWLGMAANAAFRIPSCRVAGAGAIAIYSAMSLLAVAGDFIAIRGGLTVSTMNPGRVYYSDSQRLNHAALNPAFTLLYSATHNDNFDRAFRYFEAEENARIMQRLERPFPADSTAVRPLLTPGVGRPDIYVIILESFSAHLFPSLGGEPVAERLDSIGRQGIIWSRMYASGFRTDRGIPAILSGMPAPPTASVMKYVSKAEHLPGLAEEMKKQGGYETAYYYGGDAGFTNMLGYLKSIGFGLVVSDKDFPLSSRLSKWGAHDDILFRRVLEDSRHLPPGGEPRLTVIQTSSSHEPFDVPYSNPRFAGNPAANAFAFTDSVTADFIGRLEQTPRGREAVIVMVPDHWGAWPGADMLPDIFSRHQTPMIICGGGIDAGHRGERKEEICSQTDVAATLLAMNGFDHSAFPYSHNLLDPDRPRYAWMTDRDVIALVMETPEGETVRTAYNIEGERIVYQEGGDAGIRRFALDACKAYLSAIYRTLQNL